MEFDFNRIVYQVAIFSLPIIFALTMREFAHAWMANRLGDSSARAAGRLSPNPVSHIDPIGTLLVPLVMIILPSNFLFGWARPIPLNQNQLRNPKRDIAYVASAGLLANFAMAVLWVIFLKIITMTVSDPSVLNGFTDMAQVGIWFNIFIMVINFLPLPPFDGGLILSSFLSPSAAEKLAKVEPYSFFILLAFIFAGGFQYFLLPIVRFFVAIINAIFM